MKGRRDWARIKACLRCAARLCAAMATDNAEAHANAMADLDRAIVSPGNDVVSKAN